jgi:hypothetical protein
MVALFVLLMFVTPYGLRWLQKRMKKPSTGTRVNGWEPFNESARYWAGSRVPALVVDSTSAYLERTTYE